MKERGMIFNAEMVRALLSGQKTQTRRPMKIQPTAHDHLRYDADWRNEPPAYFHLGNSEFACSFCGEGVDMDGRAAYRCPYGKPGDRIWVRETFSEKLDWEDGGVCAVNYAATCESPFGKWKPSIHMPREYARLLLEITDIRVERLQMITLGDICKEIGCGLYDFRPATYGFQVWEELWNSIYGEGSWQANPWVWVIEFKRVEGAAV